MKHLDKDLILYLDNHLLIVNKPKGMLTQPSPDKIESLETYAKEYIRQEFNKKAGIFLHTIHRLDKDVSGIVVFARSKKALSRLNASMREKAFTKIYVAKVEGNLKESKGTLKDYIAHLDYRAEIVKSNHPKAKLAILDYEVIDSTEDTSTLEIELKTGRYHQIRVQLANIGHPIIGDKKYGSNIKCSKGIVLHHKKIAFDHPVGGQRLEICCE